MLTDLLHYPRAARLIARILGITSALSVFTSDDWLI